jgi:hypothetical protein
MEDLTRKTNYDIMSAMFSGKIKLESQEEKYINAELGHGIGIGNSAGSYNSYIQRLRQQVAQNPSIYIGKNILVNGDKISIDDSSQEFSLEKMKEGSKQIPVVLVMYYNLLNETTIKLAWKNLQGEILSHSFYNIQRASDVGYRWWDMSGAYFYAPENLSVGDYQVDISLVEKKPLTSADGSRQATQVVSNYAVDFSVVE